MSESSPKKTSEADKVPFVEKLFYGAGSGSFQLSGDGVKGLANPIYNITLGLSPGLIGLVLMIARLFDAFTDPIIGKISDDTRTRWGRRRPFIFVGSFLTAGAFVLIWMVPESFANNTWPLFTYYLITMLFFYFCATIQVVPYHTLGLEMTPDYNERTVVSSYKMMFSFLFTLFLPWIFRLAQSDVFGGNTMAGMRYWSFILAGAIIVGGVLPAIFVKERYYKLACGQDKMPFWQGFRLTLQNRPFLFLTAIILTSGLGNGMVNALGPYIVYYHMYGGDTKAGSEILAIAANCFSVAAIISIPLLTRLSSKIGKVRMLQILIITGIVASFSTFFLYTPSNPYLIIIVYLLQAPTAAGFWTLTGSMKADICDDDELNNGLRREGMFGAVGGWIMKTMLSFTFLAAGLILEGTGFRVELKGNQAPETLLWMRILYALVPAISSAIGLFLLSKYTLTSDRMAEIRTELERRRQKI
jgi:GPH family glycoside/pentoside/hexuronide:cation symporter